MYPVFIAVRYDPILNYVIALLEPYSFDFADNLGETKGLARYAEAEPRIGRVQLIHLSKDPAGKNGLKQLHLSKSSVKNKCCKPRIMMIWRRFLTPMDFYVTKY